MSSGNINVCNAVRSVYAKNKLQFAGTLIVSTIVLFCLVNLIVLSNEDTPWTEDLYATNNVVSYIIAAVPVVVALLCVVPSEYAHYALVSKQKQQQAPTASTVAPKARSTMNGGNALLGGVTNVFAMGA
jgi:hypothetical protein